MSSILYEFIHSYIQSSSLGSRPRTMRHDWSRRPKPKTAMIRRAVAHFSFIQPGEWGDLGDDIRQLFEELAAGPRRQARRRIRAPAAPRGRLRDRRSHRARGGRLRRARRVAPGAVPRRRRRRGRREGWPHPTVPAADLSPGGARFRALRPRRAPDRRLRRRPRRSATLRAGRADGRAAQAARPPRAGPPRARPRRDEPAA